MECRSVDEMVACCVRGTLVVVVAGWVMLLPAAAAACCGRCLRVKIRDDYVKLTGGPKVCSSWIRLPQQT